MASEVHLPDRIELTLDEAAGLLFTLDRALEVAAPSSADHSLIRRAVRMLTGKLWPALGDILDEDEE